MGLLDTLTGDDRPEQERPKTGKGWPSRNRPAPRRDAGDSAPSRSQKNTRPPEVSERVWYLAEQWLEMAEAHYGKRPPVNKQGFAKRLSTKINDDPVLQRWSRIKPERWQERFGGHWETGIEFVNDVLAKMLQMFFEHLHAGQKEASIQFAFLDDEWDEWVYEAVTAVQVAWHKDNGTWDPPSLPSSVFDPATVGVPDPEDACTDPEYPGMTWGQVWAQEAVLEPRTDDLQQELEDARERDERATEAFATIRRAMLSNRETTTKETTDD